MVLSSLMMSLDSDAAKAIGIVITKESTAHPDATAIAFEFKRVQRQQAVNTYYTMSGKGVRLTKFDTQVVVYYPDLAGNQITTREQAKLVSERARQIREMVERYPKSKEFLQPHLDLADEIVRRVWADEVYIEGAFMKRADYDKISAQLEQQREEQIRREEDEKRRKGEQRRRALIEERRRKR